MTIDGVLIQLLCTFIIGCILVGYSVFMHEAVHGLLLKPPRLNRWVGFLCGAPMLVSSAAYRTVHLLHHKYERTDKDPDDAETVARKRSIPLALFYYLFAIIGVPVSTSQAIVGAVIGVGLARGISALNLRMIWTILKSWVATIPIAAGITILIDLLLRWVF